MTLDRLDMRGKLSVSVMAHNFLEKTLPFLTQKIDLMRRGARSRYAHLNNGENNIYDCLFENSSCWVVKAMTCMVTAFQNGKKIHC